MTNFPLKLKPVPVPTKSNLKYSTSRRIHFLMNSRAQQMWTLWANVGDIHLYLFQLILLLDIGGNKILEPYIEFVRHSLLLFKVGLKLSTMNIYQWMFNGCLQK